ncbi:tyrosine-type recombinase/integrase [Agromyces sp. SYSU T00194]|uniref:tyrosine-type recombinase/integrase n=1 Tax=Agromyces chitinivorans TaxID=3158560 RepID=UPI0033948C73
MAILDDWQLWQEAQGLSGRTIVERASTVRHLLDFSGNEPLTITSMDVIRFIARPGIGDTSRATYHASLRAFFGWMVTVDLRSDDPTAKTPRPRRRKSRPRPVPGVQLEKILAAANRRRTRMMILLAALAGLRVHEIAKFRGDDIDWSAHTLTVTGKGGKTALLPAHPQIIDEGATFPRDGWWFPAYSKQTSASHVTAKAVSSAIMHTMARAGYRGKAHQLRHWYGTELLNQGVDLRVVQTLMRHESPATTAIYTEVDAARQVAGIGRLSLPSAA